MAEEVQISGTPEKGKIRNPLGVVGLSLITLGIYYLVWYYKTQKELATIGQSRGTRAAGTSPGTSLVAVTLGIFILVPPFVSLYKACERLNNGEEAVGLGEGMAAGLLFLLILLIGPVGQYIYQANLNKVLEAQANGVAAPAAPQAPPAPPAPPPPAAPAS